MKKYFLAAVMALMLVLTACGSEAQQNPGNGSANPGGSQQQTGNGSPDSSGSQNGANDGSEDSSGVPGSSEFDWKVAPTLEYEHVFFCWNCGFSDGGMMLDEHTGEVTGIYQGHGGSSYTILYDEALRLFGAFSTFEGEHDLQLLDKDAFLSTLWIPYESELSGSLNLIYGIDSAKIMSTYEDEWGSHYDLSHALTGKAALAIGLDFVTGFEFDDGEWHPFSYEYILDPETLMVIDVYPHKRSDKIIAVQQGDYWGIVNRAGNKVIPFVFEHIITIGNDTAFAKYNGRYGILNIPE